MVIPVNVELILIVSISGIIAICIYILYLMDKLLSRIETLEESVNDSLATRKPEDLTELKKTLSSVVEQIGAINEVLESTGKDIDSINEKLSSSVSGLTMTNGKIDSLEERVFENRNEMLKIHREFLVITRKLEQIEKETEVIAARQQISGEF